jgi:hypothetical protein
MMCPVVQFNDEQGLHRIAPDYDEIDALHPNRAKVLPEESASWCHMHKICEAHLGEQVIAFREDTFKHQEEPPFSFS